MTNLGLLVKSFVENSGGIRKVEQAVKALSRIHKAGDKHAVTDYVARVVENPVGAKQLFAAALMGFMLSADVYHQGENHVSSRPSD